MKYQTKKSSVEGEVLLEKAVHVEDLKIPVNLACLRFYKQTFIAHTRIFF